MPTFPTYRGELPKCLNPLNLRHYFLLAYWVYFRPTALKCYLYQADPDLYRTGPGLGIFRTWRTPAYRNLYLMMPGVIVLLSVLVVLPVLLTNSWAQSMPINWLEWARGVAGGVVIGVTFGAVGGTVLGLAGGVALSTVSGVAGSVALGVAGGVTGGLAGGVAVGVAVGMTFGMAFMMTFGVVLGMAFGAIFGVVGDVTFSAVAGIVLGIMGDIALDIAFSRLDSPGFGVAIGMAALHVVFYPLQLGLALRSAFGGNRHPLEWDELLVLPLPGTRRALARRLQQDEKDGLRFLVEVARNPFQRWAAQVALHSYLHDQPSPMQFLYALLACPDLSTYVFAPVRKEDWERLPNIKRLLLGELDGRWVDCSSEWLNRQAERLFWALTWLLRDRRRTPLTRFAGMLYELLDEGTIEAEGFKLSAYAETYTGLTDYPGGGEIARSFEALVTFLSYDDLSALPAAAEMERNQVFGKNLVSSPSIRPTVLTALNRLGQVGAEIATYRDATSRINQLAALARATDALDSLDDYVVAEVIAPEQYILRRIIRQWRRLVSEAGGQVGRAEQAGPVANPYVAGNPVSGDLFVGREDVLRRLEELWSGTGQKPSVVLYGHRRMGKSSILHNLGARFGSHVVVVDFNMQRVGLVAGTGELLYNLALALYDNLPPAARGGLEGGEPDEERFIAHNPYTAFDRFLKQLDRVRAERRFIVTVDEFELIEALIAEGKLEARLLDFWRGLIQTYPWFVMAFAGLHTLQEMTRDYWHPLYGSVIAVPVSFLSHDAAWRLVTQPRPDFPLDYDREAVERIITLTHGQPYLVQLIGHGLVTRFNRQTFEQGIERERRFSLADVEAVITAPEFYRDGDAYFTGVWRQAETSAPPGQTAVLRALANLPESSELSGRWGALETLARHDVVKEADGRWQFTVELMRRWVAQR